MIMDKEAIYFYSKIFITSFTGFFGRYCKNDILYQVPITISSTAKRVVQGCPGSSMMIHG